MPIKINRRKTNCVAAHERRSSDKKKHKSNGITLNTGTNRPIDRSYYRNSVGACMLHVWIWKSIAPIQSFWEYDEHCSFSRSRGYVKIYENFEYKIKPFCAEWVLLPFSFYFRRALWLLTACRSVSNKNLLQLLKLIYTTSILFFLFLLLAFENVGGSFFAWSTVANRINFCRPQWRNIFRYYYSQNHIFETFIPIASTEFLHLLSTWKAVCVCAQFSNQFTAVWPQNETTTKNNWDFYLNLVLEKVIKID